MSQAISVTVGPLDTASANNICLSQTTAGAADLTLNGALVSGGVATLDTARRVLITCAGDDTGITFTVYGTDWNGTTCSETITGVSATTAQSLYDYSTVTRIATSGATSGSGVTVGTSGVASSRPIFFDTYGFGTVAIQISVSGSVNYTLQQSLDDPNSLGYTSVTWIDSPDSNVVNSSLDQQSNYAYAPFMARVVLNSGTGSLRFTVIQHASPSI